MQNNLTKKDIGLIYLECGITSKSKVNTGIQRVVKSVLRESASVGENLGLKIIPVAFSGFSFQHLQYGFEQADVEQKLRHPTLFRCLKILDKLLIFLVSFGFYRSIRHIIRSAFIFKETSQENGFLLSPINEDGVSSMLLLLDSNWDNNIWASIDAFRSKGGKVCAVLYDLIPFSHPETVAEQTLQAHTTWWLEAPLHLDAVICISESVRNDYLRWQNQQQLKIEVPTHKVGYFYLGSELSSVDPVIRLLTEKDEYFMMVGSLEPRKNHKTVLDAFDIYWKQGGLDRLVIVGAFGWKSDELVARISNHSEFNQKLFLVRDASDRDLAAMYGKTKALIIASLAEGYGLPIVEAFQRGASVICSNIPVFREVAGSRAHYFETLDAQSLATLLYEYKKQSTNMSGAHLDQSNLSATWKQSTEQLFYKAVLLVSMPEHNVVDCQIVSL